jgi:hypothetical protein
MDFTLVWEIVRIPLFVFATDVVMWFNWALKNDLTIDSYEWRILLDRIVKFGTAGVLLAVAGVDWNMAAAMSGLGVFSESWIKSLVKPSEPKTGITTL